MYNVAVISTSRKCATCGEAHEAWSTKCRVRNEERQVSLRKQAERRVVLLSTCLKSFVSSILLDYTPYIAVFIMPRTQSNTLTLAQRLQALTLAEEGIAAVKIQKLTGVSVRSISELKRKARSRGYDPAISRILKMEYVEDAPRSGRPSKATPVMEQAILDDVRKDRHGREKSSAMLGFDHNVSSFTVLRALQRNGFRACKSTKKPGLSIAMKKARMRFCIEHRDWTLEDWKNVIWSDETSVMLNAVRGRRLQWRTSKEMNERTCIRRRWKGHSEFMF